MFAIGDKVLVTDQTSRYVGRRGYVAAVDEVFVYVHFYGTGHATRTVLRSAPLRTKQLCHTTKGPDHDIPQVVRHLSPGETQLSGQVLWPDIKLTWTPAKNAKYYYVEYAPYEVPAENDYATLEIVTVTSLVHTGGAVATAGTYRVVPANDVGEASRSNVYLYLDLYTG